MIELKTPDEVEAIARAGAIIARLFEQLPERVRPGVTTADIDDFADEFIRAHDRAKPAFKGLYGFPRSVCISVNEEVVHGIPKADRVLVEGDIVSVDVGVKLDGWYADAAVTLPVGQVDTETRRLLDVAEASLMEGIREARSGRRIGDVGHAIHTAAESAGFSVVRDLVGHGLGRSLHEEPQVPNFGRPGRGLALRPGLVIAIEPMVNQGTASVHTLEDKWTVVTADGLRSSHFEHTVAITEDGPRVLTAL